MAPVNLSDALSALSGGVLIGLGAALLLLGHGRVAGISGILGGLLDSTVTDRGYRVAFLVGLVAAGGVLHAVLPSAFSGPTPALGIALASGLLVGFGTRLGNGCTSGHGVCGIARFSPRGLAATATFFATGVLGVLAARWVL